MPNPNLVITAYYDYTNTLFSTPRYDSLLESNGLVPLFRPSQHRLATVEATERLRRTFYTEFSLMTAVRAFFTPSPSSSV